MNRAGKRLAALLLATLSSTAFGEGATLARDTELRAKPLNDAAVVAPLKAKAVVDVLARSGAWAQVKTADGATGYVRLLNLRTSSGAQGGSGVGQLASVFRTGSSGNSVSTGVKGMSEEDLTGATADPAQLTRLGTYKTTAPEAREAARLAGLKATAVEYLPAGDGKKRKKKKKDEE